MPDMTQTLQFSTYNLYNDSLSLCRVDNYLYIRDNLKHWTEIVFFFSRNLSNHRRSIIIPMGKSTIGEKNKKKKSRLLFFFLGVWELNLIIEARHVRVKTKSLLQLYACVYNDELLYRYTRRNADWLATRLYTSLSLSLFYIYFQGERERKRLLLSLRCS